MENIINKFESLRITFELLRIAAIETGKVIFLEPQVLPEIKPDKIKPVVEPSKNDPFNIPFPKISPSPKAFSFLKFI